MGILVSKGIFNTVTSEMTFEVSIPIRNKQPFPPVPPTPPMPPKPGPFPPVPPGPFPPVPPGPFPPVPPPPGAQGVQGAQGPRGLHGHVGPMGPTGPAGPVLTPTKNVTNIDELPRVAPAGAIYSVTFGQGGDYEGPSVYTYMGINLGEQGTPGNAWRWVGKLLNEGPQGPRGFMGPQGPQGEIGPMGPQGPQGMPFMISRSFTSIYEMESSDPSLVENNSYVIILPADIYDPDYGKLYRKTEEGYKFIIDMSIVGPTGPMGPRGPQGIPGQPFKIVAKYKSIEEMEADFNNPSIHRWEYCIIDTGQPLQPDNGKVYMKGLQEWEFVCDMSDFEQIGPKGEPGIRVFHSEEEAREYAESCADDQIGLYVSVIDDHNKITLYGIAADRSLKIASGEMEIPVGNPPMTIIHSFNHKPVVLCCLPIEIGGEEYLRLVEVDVYYKSDNEVIIDFNMFDDINNMRIFLV